MRPHGGKRNSTAERMNLKKILARLVGGGGLLALLTLATSGLFKIAAFAREAFIASHFGLSSFTDAYFAFQQFPLMVMTFMFGAFGLAFTPAYSTEKRLEGKVAWLPGLLVYGSVLGLLLNVLTIIGSPWLLREFTNVPSAHGAVTVAILSCAFAPMIWLGIWAGVAIANGRNVWAIFVTGLPFLLMTLILLGLYALGKVDDLSLPLSFLVGFGVIGFYALGSLVASEWIRTDFHSMLATVRLDAFRRFLKQLMSSSVENLGYSANQLLLVFFLAKAGTGVVSANTCAMRVGMLGFSLLGQPLAQLVQSKLCAANENEQTAVFKKWMWAVSSAVLGLAALLYFGREPIVSLVYLRGKFSHVELSRVLEIMPAWVAYFVVASLNAIVARYLFAAAQGKVYVRRQLCAYAAANLTRFALWGQLSAPLVVWCSVAAEGCALLINLRNCFDTNDAAVLPRQLAGAQEA
jgi:peptidoglycan biosynthesis protein MviN/MurJ (putative lipid II flippase)